MSYIKGKGDATLADIAAFITETGISKQALQEDDVQRIINVRGGVGSVVWEGGGPGGWGGQGLCAAGAACMPPAVPPYVHSPAGLPSPHPYVPPPADPGL